jgi:hypothetical protein
LFVKNAELQVIYLKETVSPIAQEVIFQAAQNVFNANKKKKVV